MRKYAEFQVTSAVLVPRDLTGRALKRFAHRHHFDYDVKPGFLYVRSRMISSRCNDNYDEFPAEEIKAGYRTFIGKPVFVNHNNENHRRARGVVIDAALHEDRNPDGSPDTWVEGLMQVDAINFPVLAQAILKGHIDRTSMGTDVAYSVCSACNNKATTPAEYCQHIPRMKGQRIFRVNASTGRREGVLIRETCYGLKFFENSLLVEPPADPTAFFLGVDSRGLSTMASKTAAGAQEGWSRGYPPKIWQSPQDVADRVQEAQPKPLQDTVDEQMEREQNSDLQLTPGNHLTRPFKQQDVIQPSMSSLTQHFAEFDDPCDMCHTQPASEIIKTPNGVHSLCTNCAADVFGGDRSLRQYPTRVKQDGRPREDYRLYAHFKTAEPDTDMTVCNDCNHANVRHFSPDGKSMRCGKCSCSTSIAEPAMRTACHCGGRVVYAGRSGAGNALGYCVSCGNKMVRSASSGWAKTAVQMGTCKKCGRGIRFIDDGSSSISQWQHDSEDGVGLPHQAEPEGTEKAARKVFLSTEEFVDSLGPFEAKPRHDDPSEHPYFQKNPVSHEHVVEHWNRATDEEKGQGKNWYHDAHHVAKAIAGGDAAKGAGVLAVYSPQTPWPVNMFNAARAIREGHGIGGKGSGVMATGDQAKAADRIVHGEHHESVLKGPKVRDFAHLIEHGGDQDENHPHVVIDRHALSVATGRRVSDADYTAFPKSNPHYYGHVVDTYKRAADHLSGQTGEKVHPHQVQAATWLVRQRENAQEDAASSERLQKGRTRSRQNGDAQWQDYAKQHHPDLVGPGYHVGSVTSTNYSANYTAGGGATMTFTFPTPIISTVAFGETKAPADVDTLRDEECPVCGESESYDGNECQVCGFVAPPKMFQDPDLDMAKQLDLRKDNAEGDETGMDPSGIPGSTTDGSDQIPMDPDQLTDSGDIEGMDANMQVGPDGQPLADPNGLSTEDGVVPVDVQSLDDSGNLLPADPQQPGPGMAPDQDPGAPVAPDQLDEAGNPVPAAGVDMDAPGKRVNQGGEAFTEGPNAPQGPGGPEAPEGPEGPGDAIPGEAPIQVANDDGMPEGLTQDQPQPGTPEDGVADLSCPACGFQADAASPMSVNTHDVMAEPSTGDGMAAGDMCPNCQQALLVSVGEMNQMEEQPQPAPGLGMQ